MRPAPKIIAFPRDDIAYNECLYAAVQSLGIDVKNGEWAGRWLHENVRSGDVIHIHWPSFLYFDSRSKLQTYRNLARFYIFLRLLRLRGARIIWTAHNLYPHDGGRQEWTHRFARRVVINAAEKIFVHSAAAARIVCAEFGISAEKVIEIPHGNWIDYHPHTSSRNAARKQLGIADATYVFTFVGACRPYKNLEALIDAFAKLEGDCLLLITGGFQSNEYRKQIEERLQTLSASKYRFEPRFVGTEEMQTYVLAGDALALPYNEILTSGSAMLGLSFGVPIVAPNIGGLADLITEKCGVLYEPESNGGLVNALNAIRKHSYSARDIIEYARLFDWMTSAKILASLAGNERMGSDAAKTFEPQQVSIKS